jgi:hypothetical protein
MGGKGSGRKKEFHDDYHRLVREHQIIYDREIARIRKERKCSFEEAQKIRKQQRRKKK